MKLMDRSIEPQSSLQFNNHPVPQALILELLNHAVWAPNHRLREPWRFIYVGENSRDELAFIRTKAPGHLIITMKNESSTHKQDENLAAIFCLIQNFKLLAWDKKLGVRVSFYEWMFDQRHCQKLGVTDKERIAAVLELGFIHEWQDAVPKPAATLNWSLL
jgi:Nitroreductase